MLFLCVSYPKDKTFIYSPSRIRMSVNFLATSVPSEPDDFAGIYGIYPINRTSVGVLLLFLVPRKSKSLLFDMCVFWQAKE